MLEAMNNNCLLLLSDIKEGKDVAVSKKFLTSLCYYNMHLYSRLIDANYVRRTIQPLVPTILH